MYIYNFNEIIFCFVQHDAYVYVYTLCAFKIQKKLISIYIFNIFNYQQD